MTRECITHHLACDCREDAYGRAVARLIERTNEQLIEIGDLKGALIEAKLQITYLHDKFRETGSGNAVLARINSVVEDA